MSMERLGVRMRVRAASTADRTAVDTRVMLPKARPSRFPLTLSTTLPSGVNSSPEQFRRLTQLDGAHMVRTFK